MKIRFAKLCAWLLAFIMLSASVPGTASVSAAEQGWTERDGETYYIGSNGRRLFGWQYIGGQQYYFNDNGALASLWGIDVSEFQNWINWSKVKEAGCEFAILRLGFRSYSSGGRLYEDEYFDAYIRGARSVGIPVGIYFYSQAVNTQEAVEEAEYVLNILSRYPAVEYPIVLDIEDTTEPGRVTYADLSRREYTDIALAFCERIRQAGYTPMVYSYQSLLNNRVYAEEFTQNDIDIWYAYYGTTPSGFDGPFTIWQYSASGIVSGIPNYTDLDVTTVDYAGRYPDLAWRGSLDPLPEENTELPPIEDVSVQSVSETALQISWTPTVQADGYLIYRRTGEEEYEQIGSIEGGGASSYTDTSLTSQTAYEYQVVSYQKTADGYHTSEFAENGSGSGTPSAVTPSGLKAQLSESSGHVSLSWSKVETAEAYQVYRMDASGWNPIAKVTQNSYTDTQAIENREYQYRVTSFCTQEEQLTESAPSAAVTVNLLRGRHGYIINYPYITPSDAGSKMKPYVQELQEMLKALGYDCGTPDGDYGTQTCFGVQNFQNDHDLSADRIVGQITWKTVFIEYLTLTGEIIPEIPDVTGFPTIRQGSDNSGYVTKLQTRLNLWGYDCGTPDGIFGQQTLTALLKFQKDQGLVADGVVGQQTWKSLYDTSQKPEPPVDPEPEEPEDPESPVDVSGYPTVQYNSVNDYVKKLQSRLNELGYNCGAVDGDFGIGTKDAVIRYQKDQGLVADGVVGQQTWKSLYDTSQKPEPPVDPEPEEPEDPESPVDVSGYPTVQYNSVNDYVKKLQSRLNELGYNCGAVDGDFGIGTKDAVIRYQKDQGLVADGVVGQQTWKSLYDTSQKPEPPVDPEPEEPEDPESPVDVSGYPTVQYNSVNDYVKKLQSRLNELGYDCGAVDGDFGIGTKDAVIRYQKDQGLVSDGVVGQQTWGALYA